MTNERVCLVTGGTSGVGRAIAVGLAASGARVIITTRSEEHGERAAAEIKRETGRSQVSYLTCDLSSPESVRRLVRQVEESCDSLHLLSNNAALLTLDAKVAESGVNEILAVNYLGHFQLTMLLLDLLKRGAPSRIITVVGQPGAVERVKLPEGGLLDVPAGHPVKATANAALAKALFTRELARRVEGSGVTANMFHPGLVKSGMAKGLPWYLRIPFALGNLLLGTHSDTGVYLALDPAVAETNGEFYVHRRPAPYSPPEGEKEAAARLFEESARLTDVRL
ncbi:SDR family NAD(P)-dependent oxidoreductase [Salinispira pacifica]